MTSLRDAARDGLEGVEELLATAAGGSATDCQECR